jgi:short-subunit dehydrogenase
MAGLVAGPFMGPYNASKFAVVAISETLHAEQRMLQQDIGVSVLCPGFVSTRIFESGRNRPEEFGGPPEEGPGEGGQGRQMIENGLPPSDVADHVVDAVRDGRFYVLTHPGMKPAIEARMRGIIDEDGPVGFNFG